MMHKNICSAQRVFMNHSNQKSEIELQFSIYSRILISLLAPSAFNFVHFKRNLHIATVQINNTITLTKNTTVNIAVVLFVLNSLSAFRNVKQ